MNTHDAQNILAFLNRCDLKGNESMEMTRLQNLLLDIVNHPVQSADQLPDEKTEE